MENLTEVENRAKELMIKHNLIREFVGWSFDFDNSVRRFGACHLTKRKISLSKKLVLNNLDNDEIIIDTILHEIAHAIVFKRFGNNRCIQAHGFEWKRVCREIGANTTRCYTEKEINTVKGKFKYVCPKCGKETFAHRKWKRQKACSFCCNEHNFGRFSFDYVMELKNVA